jgi:hypothetical protein
VTQRRRTSGIRGAVVLILIAVAAALAPLPAATVERVYSRGFYPPVQQVLTSVSDSSRIALLDIAVALLVLLLVVRFVRAGGMKQGFRAVGITLLRTVAVVYLLFLVLWGLNYRRVPLEQKLDYDRTRVTRERAFDLASEAVRRLNALHAAAHATKLSREGLSYASTEAQQLLGAAKVAMFGEPKRSMLGVYFRYAAIDGMTNPIFLEIILNPDLLAVEQPEVLAHEWAHLAGYADESEANFVAWLTCLRGDALAQYSGWLSAYSRAVNVLPRDMRATLPPLEAGPRQDLDAIAQRYRRSSPVVRKVARDTYDAYLKANRIDEGIRNYDEVLSLMLGTTLGGQWSPR